MSSEDEGERRLQDVFIKMNVCWEIIVKNINENKEKLYKQGDFYNFVIQPNSRRIDLIDAINLILDLIRSDLKMSK